VAEHGWLRSGFVRRKFATIRDATYEKLREKWGDHIDLSDDSLPAILIQVLLFEIGILWKAVESVFYSRYITTARGTALDHLGQRRMLTRQGETYATGILKGTADEGTVVNVNTVVRHASGAEFVVTKQRTFPASGIIDIPIQASESGPGGNKVVGGTWVYTLGEVALSGAAEEHNFETFDDALITGYSYLPAEERFDTYQEVDVSDLRYPLSLDTLAVPIKNNSDQTEIFYFYLVVRDKDTGTYIGQTQTKHLSLEAGTEQVVSFDGQDIDVSDYTTVEVSFVLAYGSSAALGLAVNNTAPYNGGYYLQGEAQTGYDVCLVVTTIAGGKTTGGQYEEGDSEFAFRQQRAMAKGAAAIPEAIESHLWDVDGVRHVKVDFNPTLVEDSNGVGPKAVRATVADGKVRDIAEALLEHGVCAGIATDGTSTLSVLDSTGGQSIPVSFERPTEIPVYIRVRVIPERASSIPEALHNKIRDAVISYVGGSLVDGTDMRGLKPGEDVSVAQIHHAVCSFRGVQSAVVRLSRVEIPETDSEGEGSDLEILVGNPVEIATTKAAYIEVV